MSTVLITVTEIAAAAGTMANVQPQIDSNIDQMYVSPVLFGMRVIWDEPKRELNLRHGFDFADFEMAFDLATALLASARPSRTGHERRMLIGW